MKFIRKHTEGPFRRVGWKVLTEIGVIIAEILPWDISGCREEDHANIEAILSFDKMLNYLIERAEYINKILVYNYGYPKETEPKEEYAVMEYRSLKTELSRLIEMVKAAGVEVEI